MVEVTVVGYGMGKAHCEFINSVDGLNLYSVCDIDEAKRWAAESDFGVRTFENIDQVLEDSGGDLIVLATPHDTHAPLAIKVMDAGKNVIVEKVMCLNVAEADAMIDASKRNDVVLTVFHSRRWDSDYLTVKKVMESDILGEVFLVESSVDWYGQLEGWRTERKRGGGHIYDWGAHLIDQAVDMIDSKAETIFCDFQYQVWSTEVESHLKCLIRFKNRLLYEIDVGNISQISKPRWRVMGELGTLTKQDIGPGEKARVRTLVDGFKADMEIESVHAEWRDYYVNISQVFNEGAELAVKPEEVRESIAIIEAAIESAETGKSVAVG
ncbi:Gfo/Idh/MocA family protein [Candidatus Poribacteria bacterium]